MIPWDTFKTPLDAYEWAHKNPDMLFFTGGWPGCSTWILWSSREGYCRPEFKLEPVRR